MRRFDDRLRVRRPAAECPLRTDPILVVSVGAKRKTEEDRTFRRTCDSDCPCDDKCSNHCSCHTYCRCECDAQCSCHDNW